MSISNRFRFRQLPLYYAETTTPELKEIAKKTFKFVKLRQDLNNPQRYKLERTIPVLKVAKQKTNKKKMPRLQGRLYENHIHKLFRDLNSYSNFLSEKNAPYVVDYPNTMYGERITWPFI